MKLFSHISRKKEGKERRLTHNFRHEGSHTRGNVMSTCEREKGEGMSFVLSGSCGKDWKAGPFGISLWARIGARKKKKGSGPNRCPPQGHKTTCIAYLKHSCRLFHSTP